MLPFKYGGADSSLTALAEGLTEEIVTGLSRFSYLKVISRGSASDAQAAGKELGARYIMEGSLRQAGTRLRLAVQLVDAVSGAHLWAENYERLFSPEAVFELQDELVPRIVSTVADMHGVLPRSMSEVVRLKSADQMSPYEALLRSFGYNERFTPEDLAEVRTCLERAVQQSPGNAECWAMLSLMYANEYGHWDNAGPDSLDRSLQAARTAVEAAPLHSLPYYALAQALFFKREIPAFRVAAERAVSLNPMDGATAAFMGLLIAYAGDWERGCALSDKGSQLNPNHPGWYRYTAWHDAYRKKDYRRALDVALHLNAPKNYYTHAVLAICYAQLGQMEEARKALQDMLSLKPNYAEVARELHGRWIEPDLVEQLMDGLRKAGLEIPDDPGKPGLSPAAPTSGPARADEGFWVAVLPFKYGGADSSLTALAEGLTEDIVTGLSRFSYLRVIARGSTLRYTDQGTDPRVVGKELGARYVMEGTLRQAGERLRLAVQLVDATSGAHLWAENYERALRPESAFELQDDLVPRIVSMVAGMNGVLPRSMSEVVRSRAPEQLSPYEAVLRSFSYFERVTAEELAAARSGLESAVEKAPAYADAWAMLALLCAQDYGQGFDLYADSLARASTAARLAVETAPSSPLAYFSLAQALFFQKDFPGFRHAAERAAALNPMDGNSIAFLGELLTYSGDAERGLALAERAKQLNPHHTGWYWYADFYNAYSQGDDRSALTFALKINLPGHWPSHAARAAAYGQLGERDAAARAVRDLLKLRPDFAARVRKDVEKWWEPSYVERLIDGWRKAGLDVPAAGAAGGRAAQAPAAEASIAVLPFRNMSAEPDSEYVSDGITEEIINALTQIEALRVAARTSSFAFKGKDTDVRRIGAELGVRSVLEGSVRQAGQRLRITAQLIDVESGYHLWSERYDREMQDVFAVQDEIARSIAQKLEPRLVAAGSGPLVAAPTEDVEAYNLYLKGRYLQNLRRPSLAIEQFEAAVARDPRYVAAHTGIADAYGQWGYYGGIPTWEAYGRARAATEKASALAPDAAGVHLSLGIIEQYYGWDVAKEEREFRAAVERSPRTAEGHFWLSVCLVCVGKVDEALEVGRRGVALEPHSANLQAQLGWTFLVRRRFEEAEREFRKAVALDPEAGYPLLSLGLACQENGSAEEAIRVFERGVEATGGRHSLYTALLGGAFARAGRTADARRVLAELRERSAREYVPPFDLAMVLTPLGDSDDALSALERAYDERNAALWFRIYWPAFDGLRTEPRWQALAEKLARTAPVKLAR